MCAGSLDMSEASVSKVVGDLPAHSCGFELQTSGHLTRLEVSAVQLIGGLKSSPVTF